MLIKSNHKDEEWNWNDFKKIGIDTINIGKIIKEHFRNLGEQISQTILAHFRNIWHTNDGVATLLHQLIIKKIISLRKTNIF